MSFSVKILGCGSALPTTYRNATAQVVKHNGNLFLVDCAEGTQHLLRLHHIKLASIRHIFISHLHGDHFYGLFGLLSSLGLMGPLNTIYIHCPEALRNMLMSEFSPLNIETLNLKIEFVPLCRDEGLSLTFEGKRVSVYSFPLKHRIDTWGFLFKEKPLKPNIIKETISKYGLSIAEIVKIKDGCDLRLDDGSIVPNSELTIPAPKPLSYAYVSDTLMFPAITEHIKGVDLLYHEATFENGLLHRAVETFHSTSGQAATIAKEANVGKLVLGHFSSRYRSTEILENQAKEIFPNSVCAYDGMEIEINYELRITKSECWLGKI